MAVYLGFKEVWRNRGRFFLFSLVIALIAILVLFTAGLGEGLASANKEYLEKLEAQLLVFQEDTGYSTIESRIDYTKIQRVRRVEGIADAGPIAFSNVKIVSDNGLEPLDVSFIGVEAGKPGEPAAVEGENLRSNRARVVLIDKSVAEEANLAVGDTMTIQVTQGTEDELFDLRVIGITDGQQYFFRPSVFVTLPVWDLYRPKPDPNAYTTQPAVNVIAVRPADPAALEMIPAAISAVVDEVETTDIKTAYESAPGYSEQQSTLNTIRGFTFLIGALVIGGFFQIQTLQKIPQIGMLKAIGTPNPVVATASIMQIVFVTVFGVLLGGTVTLGLALGLPSGVPIIFTGTSIIIAAVSLLLIGPIGGLVSIRMALKVEPLSALGM
ncbi:MAG: ABC transporter permease [Anaerolineales bacterium]|jgi:putative ABC transport system permease protein